MKLVIGSRGSKLALWQANWVKTRLESTGHELEIRIIKTTGDKLAEVPLTQSGTKGLFIKEIEEALLAGEIDLAVHSLKDLPTDQPAGLLVAAVPEREDPRDAYLARNGTAFEALPTSAKVATSSLRRQSQLRILRPDLEYIAMRGNVDTRLKKLDRGDCAGLIMAVAGLRRLGFESRITRFFSPSEICPAVGQGALAIEVRKDDRRASGAIAPLDHAGTHQAVRAERAALKELGGGCQLPIAAHAWHDEDCLRLIGVVASPDGSKVYRAATSGHADHPEDLGRTVARELLKQGAKSVIEAL